MGTGKILIQAFLQFKNLRYIFGIELSSGRYKYVIITFRCENNLLRVETR
jgi:hypothetical protein